MSSSDLALALSAYVPRWVCSRLTRSNRISPGYSERFEAAVLFCDLAGFTPLTEALVAAEADEKGKGVEQLRELLDKLFTALIDVAHEYGGDVVRFSGDALTVLFGDSGSNEGCAQHTRRALACAIDMQRAVAPLADFKLSGVPFPLQMKIGVGTGMVLAALAGHPNLGEDMLLAGPALLQAAAGEKHAQRGDVIIPNETAQRACLDIPDEDGDGYIILHPGDPVLDRVGLPRPRRGLDLWDLEYEGTPRHLAAFIPGAVLERLQLQMGDLLPEFKPVTAMFAGFAGPDYTSDPQATARVQEYIRTAQDIIAHYKGRLAEVEAGDKGSLLFVVFGAPLSDEHDAIHAAQCALALKELPGTLRIGFATGRVFAGTIGAPLRKRYTIVGAAVNRAARLMQAAAPGQILADQATVALSSRVIAFTSLPPMKLKGIAEPVALYSVDGEHASELTRASNQLIDREVELAALTRLLDRATAGKAQMVTLEGEAGVGKSRLALEFRHRAHQAGWQILIGACQSTGTQTLYLPWSGMLREALELPPGGTLEACQNILASRLAAIDEHLVERLPLLGPVLRLPIPDNDLTRYLDARLRRDGAFEIVTALLRDRLAAAPAVLTLEDAHWADPLSLELAAHLRRELAGERLVIVLVQRPLTPPLSAPANALRQMPGHTVIGLGPLPAERGPELACACLGVVELEPAIRKLFIERGQGNPFFIEEIARMVRESGVVTRDAETGKLVVLGSLSLLKIPDTVEKLVQGRIDQLDEGCRLSLKVAAAIGREFQEQMLRGVYSAALALPDQGLHKQLDNLEQHDLIQIETPEPFLVYLFKHIITREVAYESLLFVQRRMLHEAVAQWIERTFAGDLTPYYTTLAYHYERTENHAKQLEYLAQAGRQAAKDYANEAARQFLTKALAAAGHVPGASPQLLAEIHEGLGDLNGLAGEFDQAYQHYEQAQAALAGQPPERDYVRRARLHRKMGRVREQQGNIDAAFEHLENGLRLVEPHGEEQEATQEIARLYQQGGLTYTRRGEVERALEWATHALQAASKANFPAELAQIYNLFGIIYLGQGNNQTAIEYGLQSASLYERLGDKLGAAKAYSNLGAAYSYECDWQSSLRYFQRSLYLRREIGDTTGIGFVYNNLGNIYLWQGSDLESALSALKQAEQIGREAGLHYLTLAAQASLGETCIRLDDWEAAHQYVQTGLELAGKTGIKSFSAYLSRLRAEIYADKDDLALAQEWIERGLALAEEQQQRDAAGEARCMLGKLYRLQGEMDRAEAALQASREILQAHNLQRQLGQTILEMARLRRDQGRIQEAGQALDEAAAILQRVDAQWDLAQARALSRELAG